MLRCAISDNIYQADEYGSQMLARLARAPRFNAWMADTVKPYCGQRVLEIGSGIGSVTRRLIPRTKCVASDINPRCLQTLANLGADRPYMETAYCDVTDLSSFPRIDTEYDTVICLNVIEHVDDDRTALLNINRFWRRRAARSFGYRKACAVLAHSIRFWDMAGDIRGKAWPSWLLSASLRSAG